MMRQIIILLFEAALNDILYIYIYIYIYMYDHVYVPISNYEDNSNFLFGGFFWTHWTFRLFTLKYTLLCPQKNPLKNVAQNYPLIS